MHTQLNSSAVLIGGKNSKIGASILPLNISQHSTRLMMTNLGEMDGECCEEELSSVQQEFYSKALKEYNLAVAEAVKLKKGAQIR